MLTQRNPRLRRANVMLNSFTSCIPNTPEKFSWTPEMPMGEPIFQPRMFLHQLKSTVTLKQLQCSADRHCWGQLNKQMHMVNRNMQFIDSTAIAFSSFADETLAINFNTIELERVHGIFRLPHEVESILPEGMFKTCKIHFLSPAQQRARELMLSKCLVFIEGNVHPHETKVSQELNIGDGNSSIGLKAEVSLPYM